VADSASDSVIILSSFDSSPRPAASISRAPTPTMTVEDSERGSPLQCGAKHHSKPLYPT
jgi:hypothetical protein